MSLISVNNLTFYYDGSYDNIFEDVSFQIDTNWKLGFIGRNGRGKTTFLNLLMGKYEYKGSISASVHFDYFPYEVNDKSRAVIDVLEDIYPEYEFWKVCREVSLLEVNDDIWYRPFDTLSNGEQTKVMLAVLFSRDNNFLLIDEPTNHLDMEAREVVKSYLNKKSGFILVSHDRSFLDGCIDHVLSINRANIDVVSGNFSSWWENKKRQDDFELAENAKLKKEIKRLSDAAMQASKWADDVEATKIGKRSEKYEKSIGTRSYVGEKSRRMQQRRKNLERRMNREIEEKSALLKNIEEAESIKLVPLKHHKQPLVNISGMNLYYGDKLVCRDVNLQIRSGQCIALIGRNGCGKSTLIKKIIGENIKSEGTIELASGLIISYVSQDTSFLSGELKQYIAENGLDETLFMQFLRKMDFARTQFDKKLEELSAGQKKKVLLARSLCTQAHLYVWDEPLNYIDIFSRMQIEELINQYRPTMIMVEHDKTFIESINADKVHL
ncbi:MAG: ABC-F type ribosomal protection protein [Lachnospiraceae bacterium]|nr:ABC-F type ribosomal protection protein [Lachnospiraceae bacterium]